MGYTAIDSSVKFFYYLVYILQFCEVFLVVGLEGCLELSLMLDGAKSQGAGGTCAAVVRETLPS